MPRPTITTSCGMVMIHQPRRCPSAWLPSSWYLPAQSRVSLQARQRTWQLEYATQT